MNRAPKLRLPMVFLAIAFLGMAIQPPPSFAKPKKNPRPSPSALPSPEPAKSTSSEAYKEGDAAFLARRDHSQAKKALELFRQYHSKNPKDPEAGWRHSMACYYFGLHLAKDDDERKEVYAEGREAGKKAIELAPGCAACHFWTAINMALYGQTVGAFKMFFSLGEIKDHLKESLKTDPAYANGGAYRLLGLIEQKLPGILGGSDDKAKEYFQKAIETSPDEPMNYLFMMKLLDDKFDDKKGAMKIAKTGLSVPQPSPDREESIGSLKELAEYLEAQEKAKSED